MVKKVVVLKGVVLKNVLVLIVHPA